MFQHDIKHDYRIGDLIIIRNTHISQVIYKQFIDQVLVVTGYQTKVSKGTTDKIYLKCSTTSLKKSVHINPKYVVKF